MSKNRLPYGLSNGDKLVLVHPFHKTENKGLLKKGEKVTYLEEYMPGIIPQRLVTVFDKDGVIYEGCKASRFQVG